MMELPGIIAVDLDGTLFADKRGTILPCTQAVVKACIDAGAKLVPATGRSALFVSCDQLPPVQYLITCNGGVISEVQTGKILYSHRICWQDVRAAWELTRDLLRKNNVVMQLFEETGVVMEEEVLNHPDMYAQGIPPFQMPYVTGGKIAKTSSFEEYINPDCSRVVKINFPGKSMRECPEIAELLKNTGIFSVTSDGMNIEVMARGCSKGKALLWLSNYLQVPSGKVIAFGDGNNDLSMLHCAGWGVAMGNAAEDIRTTAPYCTDSHSEDGIAHFLQRMFPQLKDIKI